MTCEKCLAGLLFASIVLVTSVAVADVMTVEFQLSPPAGPNNVVALGVRANFMGSTRNASGTSLASGYTLADLVLDFHPATQQVSGVSEIELSEGRISLTDLSMELDFGWLRGEIDATARGIAGTLLTPDPPSIVTDGRFSMLDHLLVLNEGTFEANGHGLIGNLLPQDPYVLHLSSGQIEVTTDGTAYIDASLLAINEETAVYDATLTLPVQFSGVMLEPNLLSLSIASTLRATGRFERSFFPLYWDEQGSGNWYDMAGDQSRWRNREGEQLTVYPDYEHVDVVVTADMVTVAADRVVRRLAVEDGGKVAIADGVTLDIRRGGVFAEGTNLVLGANARLKLGSDGATINSLTAHAGAAIDGNADILGSVSFANHGAMLAINGVFELGELAEFAAGLAKVNNLIAARDEAWLDGTLTVKANGKLKPDEVFWGNVSRTILTAKAIHGTFASEPTKTDHLGFGVFHQGVTYSPDETVVDVLQAAPGDVDGNRKVDIVDILAIKSSPKGFGTGATDADWTDGDIVGIGQRTPANGIVDIWDILAIKRARLFDKGLYADGVEMADEAAFTSAVPEPSTITMLLMSLAIAITTIWWRRP